MHIGYTELLLIVLLVLVLFGTNRLPKIMENFANGIKSFKKTMNENDSVSTSSSKGTKRKPSSNKKTTKPAKAKKTIHSKKK